MSLSISRNHANAGFVKTTIYNSKEKYIGKSHIDLRIYLRRVIVYKVSYFWNDSKPKRLTPESISFEGQTYYFSTIKIPCIIGENTLTICNEIRDLDGNLKKDVYTFKISIER